MPALGLTPTSLEQSVAQTAPPPPQEAPATVPSEVYGGPSHVEPQGFNDPNVIVTSYPSTGAEPTAQYTDYQWTQHGRTPPPNYNKEFPAAALATPEVENTSAPVREDYYYPGPPRDFVPGSTYVPQNPSPDPRVPFEERIKPGVNPSLVPGSQTYRRHPEHVSDPYVSPGLGAYAEGPLSPEGRPLAPRQPDMWAPPDAREPQEYQPGSSYDPNYVGLPSLGDPDRLWEPVVPSEWYGRGLPEHERRPDKRRVDTIYPMSGAAETMRSTGYLGEDVDVEMMGDPFAIDRERVYSDEYPMGLQPGAYIQDREYVLWLMEQARRRRQQAELAGLFGGN